MSTWKQTVSAILLCAFACKETRKPEPIDAGAVTVAGPWAFGGALPGTGGFPESMVRTLDNAWSKRASGYQPRTRHVRAPGEPRYTNRLFLESSPYLRQHAHNPVNWFPWGEQAFAEARRLGRPVLLSIGYSTCHWCHVMEEESFEDEALARQINESYIAIKVDREERPDIDHIYMTAVQTLTGGGGWPLTVWLTPERRPFFGGTYYPPEEFARMLTLLKTKFDQDPSGVATQARTLTSMVERTLRPATAKGGDLDVRVLHAAVKYFTDSLDESTGGMRRQPKFPSDMPVRALLRYHRRTGDKAALEAVLLTLQQMAAGGIYDHVGGGFHRYATDERWRIPHFEKMLYDNALLVMAYSEAHQVKPDPVFARVVAETVRWVEREMTAEGGGFFSALDADSLAPGGRRIEGWFYTWTPAELEQALGKEPTPVVIDAYGVTSGGNLEGRNVLARTGSSELPPELREKLYEVRARRPAPLRDEKILTAWNGLMISALAQAAMVFAVPDHAARAVRAGEFLWSHARDQRGRLYRSVTGGQGRLNGYLEDHAFLAAAFLDLFEATADPRWFERARELDRVIETRFEDSARGGFYRTSDDHEALLVRDKPGEDGPIPSGTSVHIVTLLRLHEFTHEDRYRIRAERALRAHIGTLRREPAVMPDLLLALDYFLDRPKQIVIVFAREPAEAAPFLRQLGGAFVPNRALVVANQKEIEARATTIPLLVDKRALKGKATAFVCELRTCQLPTGDPAVFARQLRKVFPLPATGSAGPSSD